MSGLRKRLERRDIVALIFARHADVFLHYGRLAAPPSTANWSEYGRSEQAAARRAALEILAAIDGADRGPPTP
jgi:hypothetical protein